MPVIESTQRLKTVQGEYDFAVDGGAVGTITLRTPPGQSIGNEIPNGAVIMGGYIEVDTAVTSGGAGTVAVTSEGAGDIQTAAAVSGAPWSSTGRKNLTGPAFTGASSVKTTARRSLAITVATAALTAGKFRVVLFYR